MWASCLDRILTWQERTLDISMYHIRVYEQCETRGRLLTLGYKSEFPPLKVEFIFIGRMWQVFGLLSFVAQYCEFSSLKNRDPHHN